MSGNETLAVSRWERFFTMALIVVSTVVILFPAARSTSLRIALMAIFVLSATLHLILDHRAGLLGKTMGQVFADVRAGRIKYSRVSLVAYTLACGALFLSP